jgi:ribose 5-phosphate isomerase B
MKIYLASDHAGFALKNELVQFLREQGKEAEDLGPATLDSGDDYPDFIMPLAKRVAAEEGAMGVALGGSGEGEAMAANRIEGVRAAEYYGGNLEIVTLAREHNDANVLSLGARFVNTEEAKQALALFLETPFSGDERHERRINKLDESR